MATERQIEANRNNALKSTGPITAELLRRLEAPCRALIIERDPWDVCREACAELSSEFTAALGRALHRPAVLLAPAFALRLALGEAANTVVLGQRVLPERTMATGYRFRYSQIDAAFAQLFGG